MRSLTCLVRDMWLLGTSIRRSTIFIAASMRAFDVVAEVAPGAQARCISSRSGCNGAHPAIEL
jgi:hypothetical protein